MISNLFFSQIDLSPLFDVVMLHMDWQNFGLGGPIATKGMSLLAEPSVSLSPDLSFYGTIVVEYACN